MNCIRFFYSPDFNRLFCQAVSDSIAVSYQFSEANDAEALDRCVRGWYETNSSKLRFRSYSVPLGGQTDWYQILGIYLENDEIDLVRKKLNLLPNLPTMSKAVTLVDKLDLELNPDFEGKDRNRNGLFQTFVVDRSWVEKILGDLIDRDEETLSPSNVAAALGKLVSDAIQPSIVAAQ